MTSIAIVHYTFNHPGLYIIKLGVDLQGLSVFASSAGRIFFPLKGDYTFEIYISWMVLNSSIYAFTHVEQSSSQFKGCLVLYQVVQKLQYMIQTV